MPERILTARRLVTDIGTVEFPVVTVAPDGTLRDIRSDPGICSGESDTLTAAFLDIHTHGAVGHDVMSATPGELRQVHQFLARHGVAHYLPTTATASLDVTLRALDALATAVETPVAAGEAHPIGIHLEGPFLAHAKRGVHPAEHLQPPSIELFERLQQAARGHIRLMTIAPELRGAGTGAAAVDAADLIRHVTSQGVRVSLGHSNALAQDTLAAIDAGACSATHTFNAMRALDHREPGVLGVVLDDSRLYAEVICDGVHVAPELVRLWLRAKGQDRAILVTDAMAAAGMPDGAYALAGLPVTVSGGRAVLTNAPETLAGSVLTMDAAVRNCCSYTRCTLSEAVRCASHNPARMLGQPELTRLAPGAVANLNRFNARGERTATYLRGVPVPPLAGI